MLIAALVGAAQLIAGIPRVTALAATELGDLTFETALPDGVMFARGPFGAPFATEDQREGMGAFVVKCLRWNGYCCLRRSAIHCRTPHIHARGTRRRHSHAKTLKEDTMHPTAQMNCQSFFEAYAASFTGQNRPRVIEIGSQDVNGSLRSLIPSSFDYVGVDFVPGRNVDVVLSDPYILPFETDSTDIIISSSCFEHSEMFWLVFLEVMRVLKQKGLFYLNAPSNGPFHRHPVDCWRFYPDSGNALVTWARRNSIPAALLESYTSVQTADVWNDFVAVFLKNEQYLPDFPRRILSSKTDINNGITRGAQEFVNYVAEPEDRRKLIVIEQILNNKIRIT